MDVSDQGAHSKLAISDAWERRIVASNAFGTSGRLIFGAFLQKVEGSGTLQESSGWCL